MQPHCCKNHSKCSGLHIAGPRHAGNWGRVEPGAEWSKAESSCRAGALCSTRDGIWEFFSLPPSQTPTPTPFSGETRTPDSDDLPTDILGAVVQLQTYKNASSFCYHLSPWDSAPKEPQTQQRTALRAALTSSTPAASSHSKLL